ARTAGALDEATVFEFGPGPGGLTRAILALGARKVIAIEQEVLHERLARIEAVTLDDVTKRRKAIECCHQRRLSALRPSWAASLS
ncbi:hypothetical protein ACC695_39515, partial [Rhizobium ruizarguesonis]